MEIPLEVARRLFKEANCWHTGECKYLGEESELRVIARSVFHQDHVAQLDRVAAEIFRVVAEQAMSEPVDWKASYEQACKDADEFRDAVEDECLKADVGQTWRAEALKQIRALVNARKPLTEVSNTSIVEPR